MNRPKAKGTRAESAVAKHFRAAGIPADRTALAGNQDRGDLWVCGGRMVVEVKSRAGLPSHAEIHRWYGEMTAEAERVPQCDIGVLIVKRPGSARVGQWWAWFDHDEWMWVSHGIDWTRPYPICLTVETLTDQLVRLGWAL